MVCSLYFSLSRWLSWQPTQYESELRQLRSTVRSDTDTARGDNGFCVWWVRSLHDGRRVFNGVVMEGWIVFLLVVIAAVLILGRVDFDKKLLRLRVESWKEPY